MGRQDKDSLTPITDLREMGSAIAIIKRDVKEMKPEVKETVKAVVALITKERVTDGRVKTLETTAARLDRETASLAQPRSHDCVNVYKIGDLEEDSKKHTLGVADNKKDVVGVITDVSELKQGQSKFVFWLLGAALAVIASVVGWYASYQVTTNEVRHLTVEQIKIRTNLEELQKTTKNIPVKLNMAVERVETAARRIKPNDDGILSDEIWCILSNREKARLKRRLSSKEIPNKRCP